MKSQKLWPRGFFTPAHAREPALVSEPGPKSVLTKSTSLDRYERTLRLIGLGLVGVGFRV